VLDWPSFEVAKALLPAHEENGGVIDKSGQWWKGQGFEDLVEYLRQYTSRNYPAGPIVQSLCAECGSATFALVVDDDEGCAKRQCGGCDAEAFIGDSDEVWDDADPGEAACPCGGERFEVGVAFSLRDDGSVCWITVGARCVACGVLGVYADWKIDYDPTDHLLTAV
jgi:hypothetical protein